MTSPLIRGVALGALLFTTACQTAEERADSYYQSGLELYEAGDTARAMIELRNVFEHDGFHKEARLLYARLLTERGEDSEAYGQYLRLIEQYPNTVDVRLTLAEMALKRGDWREVTRHSDAAHALEPSSLRLDAIRAALAYRAALRASDVQAEIDAIAKAEAVLTEDPNNVPALRIVIDARSRSAAPEEALPLVERALAITPDSFEFHTAKLRLFTLMKDDPAAISQLETMFARFPDNPDVRTTLVNWHLSQQNYAAAEKILRDLSGDPSEDATGAMTVVEFLRQAQGPDAALAELAELIETTGGSTPNDLYRAMSAMIAFETDTNGPGLENMRVLVDGLDRSDQSRRIRAMYARMLNATGETEAASELTDAILAEDRSNTAALKLKAGWAIEADAPDQAINHLRTALSQSPRDPEIMMLMATAHERSGFPELAGERLALAVEVSGAAPEPALRYARFLVRDGRTQAATSVLNDARRAAPGNLELVSVLADLYLNEKDWGRARGLLRELRAGAEGNPRALQVATALEAAILSGQDRTDESLAVLEDQLGGLDDDGRATLTIALAQVRAGKVEEARAYLDRATSSRADNVTLQLLSGSVAMMDGDADAAEKTFRNVLDKAPDTEAAVRLLYSLLHLQGRDDEKAQILDAGLQNLPESETLLWIKAGALERDADIDGAIAIYEKLYAADSGNVIIANNLASLLATYREDEESLDRAFRVARRLRGMEVPAFQDTYGWIAFRRGDYAEALDYLKPAAGSLPGDPLVQYHLGRALHAVGQKRDAQTALVRALELAGDRELPQFATAREMLEEMARGAQ